MRVRVVLASVLLLFGVACGESSDEPAPVAAPSGADVTPDVEAPAAPAENASTAIEPAKAKVFLTFQEGLVAVLHEASKEGTELQQSPEQGENAGSGGFRAGDSLRGAIGDRAEELTRMREDLGLSEYEVKSLSEIEASIFARGSGDALVAQIAELEKSVADLPVEQRGEAEKALRDMRQLKASIVDMQEARAKYGDAIVDAMLALEPELRSQLQGIVGPR